MTAQRGQKPIVSVTELAANLGDPGWVVVDCRFDLTKTNAGREAWAAGHIPGAFYADLDRDLASPVRPDGNGGRHPLPDPDILSTLLRSWGVGPGSTVVAYDDVGNAIAARLWWLLRWLGHERVAVLDGGLAGWRAAGQELSAVEPEVQAGTFNGQPGSMPVVDAEEIEAGLDAGECVLLDARAPNRFRGEVEPLDTKAGHVPGAINTPLTDNLATDKCFRGSGELQAYYGAAIGDSSDNQAGEVVATCGSGVTACHVLLALELAGRPGASLYVGSWSDWISDDERPIATGE